MLSKINILTSLIIKKNKNIMKRSLIILLLLFNFTIYSQIKTPDASPATKIEQTVGLTDFTVQYARPSVKEREVYGNLVPFDKPWRTGANQNSVISFNTTVKIGGNSIPAGKYSIYTIPSKDTWEFILYSDSDNWGLPREWDENKIVISHTVSPYKLPNKVETFNISFDNLNSNSFTLGISWDYLYVPVTIELPTNDTVMSNIKDMLKEPNSSDLYKAAVYLLQENIELNKALSYMNQAISMMDNPRFYQLRQQSLIYAALKDYSKAIEIAKLSLEKSINAGNADYEKMNRDSIEAWSLM